MIAATLNTTQTYNYSHQTSKKSNESNFEESLQNEQTLEAQQTKTEEVKFKMIERMSFEYIKNIDKEKIEEVYSDLSREDRGKIYSLHHISNSSENDTLNKVLFDKAKDMSQKEAMSFSFQKASEQYHYKTTGTGQRFVINTNMFIQDSDGKITVNENMKHLKPEEYKLSHEQAFNMLLDMISSSKEGMEKAKSDEIKKQYEEVLNDYTDILERYNREIRQNITGTL